MSTNTNLEKLKQIIEGALLAAGKSLSIDQILSLFLDEDQPSREEIREALTSIQQDCENRGVELKEVSTGFRFQVKADLAPWVARLWEEKPAKYSRAVLETLALIAYRQPITRSEIEDVRGVAVSSHIVKSLLEREWIRVIGHRDVPGKPALYGTSKTFLDYFGLTSLSDLPPLAELRNIESIEHELDFGEAKPADQEEGEQSTEAANDAVTDEGDVQPVPLAENSEVSAQNEAEQIELVDETVSEEPVEQVEQDQPETTVAFDAEVSDEPESSVETMAESSEETLEEGADTDNSVADDTVATVEPEQIADDDELLDETEAESKTEAVV